MKDTKLVHSLKAQNLCKVYNKRTVVDEVSLCVRQGEIVGLLGPNGSGKTTCFTIIAGLIPPTRGDIFLEGQEITHLPMYRRARMGLGYLPQEASIFRGLSVENNIRAILEVTEKETSQREKRLEELLNEFMISHLRCSLPATLSGGERRRVEIARALAANPFYMMLDEPFAGIDPIAVGDIQDLVLKLKKLGIGVLITDHNVRETLGIVDRAYIISEGKTLMEGTPEEIIAHKDVRRVYLGESFNF